MDKTFYISNGGDALGPYEIGQLRSMWSMGQISANSLYWSEESNEWRSIVELSVSPAQPAAPPIAPLQTTKPAAASISFKEKNPIGYWVLCIGGIGFGLGFLGGLSASSGIGLLGSIAFSIGHGIPMFLLFAAVGGIVGLIAKRKSKG